MSRESDQQDLMLRFRQRYGIGASTAARAVEMKVIGSDYGANGYTTRAEADELAIALELDARARLLDLGAGRGWPGLYLAAATGCDVVLSDVPVEGLHHAQQRIAVDDLSRRAFVVAAGGAELPFPAECFDAVVHTDTLC